MSAQTSRGRSARTSKKKNNNRMIWIIGGAIAILAVILIAVSQLNQPSVASVTPRSSGAEPRTTEGFYYKGPADAKVVVTEYADFQCPGCAYFARSAAAAFEAEYVATGKIQFVYHEYPLSGHANAVPAAEAARCAGDQNAFWAMHGLLFNNQRVWASLASPNRQFVSFAQQLGLNTETFSQCLDNGTYRQAILAARDAGNALRLPGTPSFAVNGKLVDNTGAQSVDDIVARVRAAIEAELAQ
jgi:protein-disulfide isomerase